MYKRIVASILGGLAVFASLIAFFFAIEELGDFWNPAVPLGLAIAGLFMWPIALAVLGLGIRFLRFAVSARRERSRSRATSVLLGIGFFFPGFLFSLPLTVRWARHTWPGDGQSSLAAMEWSFYIGIAAAIVCCVVLLRKPKVQESQ